VEKKLLLLLSTSFLQWQILKIVVQKAFQLVWRHGCLLYFPGFLLFLLLLLFVLHRFDIF